MSSALKCPCCGKTADHLVFRNVEARGPNEEVITSVVLSCPGCELVLGASVNPSEYVAAMLRQIRTRPEDEERPFRQKPNSALKVPANQP